MSFTLVGAAALFIGEFVSFLAPSKFPAIFFNIVGFLVPSGPFTDVITSVFGTSAPVPSGFSKNLVVPSACFIGYTGVPSALVYTTGVTELFVDTWSFTSTVIVLTPSTVLPLTVAVPLPTNLTSLAFLTWSL